MTPSIFEQVKEGLCNYFMIVLQREQDCEIKMNDMLSTKDVTVLYETLLNPTGMNDTVKISLHIPRKNVLLLSKIIELGLSVKDNEQNNLLQVAGQDVLSELNSLTGDLLQKAGLTEIYNKLNSLQVK